MNCEAELLAIELLLNNNSKRIISSCYRVGTLGNANLAEISKSIKALIRKREVNQFILVGDLNLPKIDWNNYSGNVTLEQDFLNTFAENSLLQRIDVPTHRHGNTLDLLLTLLPNFVENIVVRKDTLLCKSDHF